MQRMISALTLAIFMTVVVGGCQRPSTELLSQAAASEIGVQTAEPASDQGSTQEVNQTEAAPKTPAEPVYSVVSPLGDSAVTMITMAPRLDTLAGKTVCMIWNQSFQADITLPAIGESLKEKYPDIKIIPYTEIEAALPELDFEDRAAEAAALQVVLKEKGCDAVISGNGG